MDWIIIWVVNLISFKLSTSGWRFLLKEILKFSFKRAHRIQKKMVEVDTKRDFWEATYIQYYLETKGYTIIFLDEFHINMRCSLENPAPTRPGGGGSFWQKKNWPAPLFHTYNINYFVLKNIYKKTTSKPFLIYSAKIFLLICCRCFAC